ncbi:class I SAM-dependent methyltransferase [Massilia oculi]|uniref:Class I SAM-dependent methyltransferase n=1 Tax=Massilia hydrophila TaxID=3044279 RepID=A0ABS7YAE9_9BURK|nr:class I SAM-dependent methyltransferase [Massilia oculi]MCA1855365.1 class I SAM-dependent methyltransferase [Massilia oculi]
MSTTNTMSKKFSPPGQRAFDARFEAQKIAFGPVVFQCVRHAWKRGMLQAIADAGAAGVSVEELAATGRWTPYALKLVLETCLSAGVVYLEEGRYVLDKAGFVVLTDPITQVNIDFNHDVCYQALFALDASLDAGQPLGLKVFGDWPTVYEGLAQLPEPARSSWFAFDHYYSDTSFPDILPDVFATSPRRVMDIGANTGKFTLAALGANERVTLHLVDLPGQLAVADEKLRAAGLRERATLHPTNLLDDGAALPGDMDLIWMSQFLSCFSEAAIASIFRRVAEALGPRGQVLVLDTFWDRQRYDIAAYCLINTSPYFTAIASGNSKVYESADYVRLAEAAGLRLVTTRDGIGYCHSLLRFEKA